MTTTWTCERCHKEKPYSKMQYFESRYAFYECTDCLAEIEAKITAFVAKSSWGFRNEDTIFTHLLGRNHWGDKEPTLAYGTRVDDILFNLVLTKRLLWRDIDDTGEKPLRYSIPTTAEKGRKADRGELDSDVLPAQVVAARRARERTRRARHANQQDLRAAPRPKKTAHRVRRA